MYKTLKFSRKIESALLLLLYFFLSKRPGGHAIYRRNARLLEMEIFTPAYMKGGSTYEHFSQNQIFIPMVLRWARLRRARELRYDLFCCISKNASVTDSVSFPFLGLSCCRCNCISQRSAPLEPEESIGPQRVS